MNVKHRIPLVFTSLVFLIFLFGTGLRSLLTPDPTYLVNERRRAEEAPSLSRASLVSGEFSEDLESYLLDTLPERELLRRMKLRISRHLLRLSDEDGVFLTKNGLAKDLSPMNTALVTEAGATFDRLIASYFPNRDNIYLSVIPDKAYYAREKGLTLDCSALAALLSSSMEAEHTAIDLAPMLSLDAYYATDIHWKPEAIPQVAALLGTAMDFSLPSADRLRAVTLGSFVGTLGAQTPMGEYEDDLTLLYDTDGVIESAVAEYPDGTVGSVYDTSLFTESYDKYDVFLRGETVGDAENRVGNFFIKIKSPLAKTSRKLILFRDSFSRALVPYLLFSYSEIVLVDLRAPTAFYGENAALLTADENTDVLFLVSVHTLNTTAIR